MKTILVTAYAIHPEKGSEDGMGWHFTEEIGRYNRAIVITRKNNRPAIEKRLSAKQNPAFDNVTFQYYDLPYFMRFWKKGGRGALLYFYLWQLFLPFFVWQKRLSFDLVHNLNFHNDWTPSFLWLLGKPLIWGPVGHHPKIPRQYLQFYGKSAYRADRLRWIAKRLFWSVDPFLRITAIRADHVLCMNSTAQQALRLPDSKCTVAPSVASETIQFTDLEKESFQVLSVGRFVPLKGFDLTIEAFAHFFHQLDPMQQKKAQLTLIGRGPERERLEQLCRDLDISSKVNFIEWMPREELVKHYRESRVFLFPSHEGAGMVVAEAMSYGLPVVCLDNAGPGEFVDNTCGKKVKLQDRASTINYLAWHLKTLHHNKAHRELLAAGAKKRHADHFTWKQRGLQLKAVYDMVATTSAKASTPLTSIKKQLA